MGQKHARQASKSKRDAARRGRTRLCYRSSAGEGGCRRDNLVRPKKAGFARFGQATTLHTRRFRQKQGRCGKSQNLANKSRLHRKNLLPRHKTARDATNRRPLRRLPGQLCHSPEHLGEASTPQLFFALRGASLPRTADDATKGQDH